jgi:Uma2 family endonuclease
MKEIVMSTTLTHSEPGAIVIHFGPMMKKLNDEDFFEFCRLNSELRIERTKEGDLIIMPPAFSKTGERNFALTVEFGIWTKSDSTGVGFDSSTGFTLPNGAMRSPDLSWIRVERWNELTDDEQNRFAPICPDFVVELRSESDRLNILKEKMAEYINNGAQLGWLIDPFEKNVYVYRQQSTVECLANPDTVSGEPLLPGFVLEMKEIWDKGQ